MPGLESGFTFVQWNLEAQAMPTTVYELNLVTGRKATLVQLMPADPAGIVALVDVEMSRDGKSYAYNYGSVLSQLVVVEGLK